MIRRLRKQDVMRLFKKEWTSAEADEWTIHDTVTVLISPVIYVIILVGFTMSVLLIPLGFAVLAAGAALFIIMIRIVNPKLTAVSKGYEKKQKEYIEDLERKVKWEE